MRDLETWLQWCLDNCDDSPEHHFGTEATEKMRALLRGEANSGSSEKSEELKHGKS